MKTEKTRQVDSQNFTSRYRPIREANNAPSWHTVCYDIDKISADTYIFMHQWCHANCNDCYSSHGVNYYFESSEDEFKFRLRWGDYLHS